MPSHYSATVEITFTSDTVNDPVIAAMSTFRNDRGEDVDEVMEALVHVANQIRVDGGRVELEHLDVKISKHPKKSEIPINRSKFTDLF